MSKLLRATNIFKEYLTGGERLRVLQGLSLEVKPGEFLMIVGASGAGKSTLLHILGLLDTPTEGALAFDDRDVALLRPAEGARIRNRDFGFVFQFFHLLPDFNALENVYLPATVRRGAFGWARKKKECLERAKDLLDRVGLGGRLKHRPSELSGGERQRVAIARALMNEPRIVFLDEPTGNLDTRTGEAILDLILDLNRSRGQTAVMVTHNEKFAARGSRVLRLQDGRIV